MKDFLDDLERTASRTRTLTVNGVEYTIQCTDPYGFWHIEDCPHPDLDGTWTSIEKVERSIAAYEAKKEAKVKASLPENKPKKNKSETLLA